MRCSRCGNDKDVSDFARDATRPSGLSYWCKPCRNLWRWGRRFRVIMKRANPNGRRGAHNRGRDWGRALKLAKMPSAKVHYFRGQRVRITEEGKMMLESMHPKKSYPAEVYAVIVSFTREHPSHARVRTSGRGRGDLLHMKFWRPA